MTTHHSHCPLCRDDGGTVLWRGPQLRVIEVEDIDYPGFTRVIWNAHASEMTELSEDERNLLMRTVYVVEQAQREALEPDKVNLASLGNMVPHVHWHVIPRWRNDRHFPDAIWASPRVEPGAESPQWRTRQADLQQQLPRYRSQLVAALDAAHIS